MSRYILFGRSPGLRRLPGSGRWLALGGAIGARALGSGTPVVHGDGIRGHGIRALAVRALALLGAAFASIGAVATPHHVINWNAYVALSPQGGHVIGNPAAKVKLVEYMSYTCPHCAAFEVEGVAPLRLGYVMKGDVSFEVRHYMRDSIDITVAQLTNCAPPQHFFVLHEAFLHRQDEWIATAQRLSRAQTERWNNGTPVERMRAITGDLGFYAIMETHGYGRVEVDHCLADTALSHRLAAQTEAADKEGVSATPSFEINGMLLAGTYGWQTLEPQIQARLQ